MYKLNTYVCITIFYCGSFHTELLSLWEFMNIFTHEIGVLALLDDDPDDENWLKMVANLHREIFLAHEETYIPS